MNVNQKGWNDVVSKKMMWRRKGDGDIKDKVNEVNDKVGSKDNNVPKGNQDGHKLGEKENDTHIIDNSSIVKQAVVVINDVNID